MHLPAGVKADLMASIQRIMSGGQGAELSSPEGGSPSVSPGKKETGADTVRSLRV